jgi:hypothetical protein
VIKLNLSLQANSFIASFRRRLSLPDSRASVMPVCATFGGACNICEYLLDPFAHLLFPRTIIRMMTTITIMSSFPNRFDHDEDYLFGQPSLAACILASKFLSDTTLKPTSFHIYSFGTLC